MSNARLPQLNPITSTQIATDDLFLVSDISAFESKKLTAAELKSYVGSGSNSISASYALTSSRALSVTTASYSFTSSYALNGLSSSVSTNSTFAITASYALNSSSSGSYALTASHLQYTPGFYNGRSSASDSASIAALSNQSIFLIYNGASSNGTASNARTASYALSSSNAQVASTAGISVSSSFLVFSANNGTASYALRSGNTNTIMKDWGPYKATVHTSGGAYLATASIKPSTGVSVETQIWVFGDAVSNIETVDSNAYVKLGWTSSNGSSTGNMDSSSISSISDTGTGYTTRGFTLMGSANMSGSYIFVVSSSLTPPLSLDTKRAVRFLIRTYSDSVGII